MLSIINLPQVKSLQLIIDRETDHDLHRSIVYNLVDRIINGIGEITAIWLEAKDGSEELHALSDNIIYCLIHRPNPIQPHVTKYLPIEFNNSSLTEVRGVFPNLTTISFVTSGFQDHEEYSEETNLFMANLLAANYQEIIIINDLLTPLDEEKYRLFFTPELRHHLRFIACYDSY